MNEVQRTELEVYKQIAKVCNEHKLKYFAIGGTSIGAVRHSGFIPWDDDIDIAMPRTDYEAFRSKYFKELPDYYKKLDCDNSSQHEYTFMKIHDSRTTYVENYAKGSLERYTGAFVDIMPVDGLPLDSRKREKVVSLLVKYGYLNARNRPIPFKLTPVTYLFKYIIKYIFRLFHRYNYYSDRVMQLGSQYDFDESEKCVFTWRCGSLNLSENRLVFDKKMFEKTIDVAFEDTIMRIPAGYDDYLKQDFGEYMKLPPEDKRYTHHLVYINDMSRPCKFYVDRDGRRFK